MNNRQLAATVCCKVTHDVCCILIFMDVSVPVLYSWMWEAQRNTVDRERLVEIFVTERGIKAEAKTEAYRW